MTMYGERQTDGRSIERKTESKMVDNDKTEERRRDENGGSRVCD